MADIMAGPGYYDQVYRNYDAQNPPYKLAHYVDVLRRFAPTSFSHLDVGCAKGIFLRAVHNQLHVTDQYGLDLNGTALALARQVVPDATFVLGGMNHLNHFPVVDVITALDILEHLPDLQRNLTKLARQLKPQGILLAVMPVYDGPVGPIVYALDRDPTHVHQKSRGFWINVLKEEFEIVHWHGILRYLPPLGPYLHIPTFLFRKVAPALLVVCRKKETIGSF